MSAARAQSHQGCPGHAVEEHLDAPHEIQGVRDHPDRVRRGYPFEEPQLSERRLTTSGEARVAIAALVLQAQFLRYSW
jgi:hypothetical protein